MENNVKKTLNRRQVLALRGLRLPASSLRSLRLYGIVCDPSISMYWQRVSDLYLLRARECGGAVADVGTYCGLVGESAEPLQTAERLSGVGRNGFHAVVLAAKLIRIQVFRNRNTYDLLITRHRLVAPVPGRKRPKLENAILFHGVRGALTSAADQNVCSAQELPIFDDGFGTPVTIPTRFEEVVRRAISGCRCIGCNHAHLLPL
jgi:hypothetical protein